MPTVWIVSDSGHDYSKALTLGAIRFVFNETVNVFASDRLIKDLQEKIRTATADDYILPSGATLANCLIFHMMLTRFERVNILIYSFKKEKYEVRSIYITQFNPEPRPPTS